MIRSCIFVFMPWVVDGIIRALPEPLFFVEEYVDLDERMVLKYIHRQTWLGWHNGVTARPLAQSHLQVDCYLRQKV